MEEPKFDPQLIVPFLDMLHQQNKKIQKTLDCVLHTLCDHNDDETSEAIRKYLMSEYRNNQSD